MVRQCPDVRFVLDHIGKPAIKADVLDPWRQDLQRLATLPNVHCKISGVVDRSRPRNWTRAQIRPYIDHAIETFGFDRIMYGGDWHVLELAGTYPDWVDIVDEVTRGARRPRSAEALPRQRDRLLRSRPPETVDDRARICKAEGYSASTAMRTPGPRRPAALRLRLRRWRGRGRMDASPQRGGLRRFRAGAQAPEWRRRRAIFRLRSSASALSMPRDHRPDGPRRPLLAGGRAMHRARGRGRRHGVLPQPWLGLHAGGARGDGCRAALDAGLHLPGPRLHARTGRARAEAAGYDALVLTIDNQLLGNRERDIRNGFAIPPRFGAGGPRRDGAEGCPGSGACARPQPRSPSAITSGRRKLGHQGRLPAQMPSLLDPSMSWADVDVLRRALERPADAEGRPASR